MLGYIRIDVLIDDLTLSVVHLDAIRESLLNAFCHKIIVLGQSNEITIYELPEFKKRYWGQHLWARGYFFATVVQWAEEII